MPSVKVMSSEDSLQITNSRYLFDLFLKLKILILVVNFYKLNNKTFYDPLSKQVGRQNHKLKNHKLIIV